MQITYVENHGSALDRFDEMPPLGFLIRVGVVVMRVTPKERVKLTPFRAVDAKRQDIRAFPLGACSHLYPAPAQSPH